MTETIRLTGTLKTVSPMIHVDGASGTTIYCMKSAVPFTNEDGDTEMRVIPYVQGSSYRGGMRNAMAEVLSNVVRRNGSELDLNTGMRLFSGGKMEAGVAYSLAEARDIVERCVDLVLFGGGAGIMFKGSLAFDMLYPIVDTTVQAKIVPSHYAKYVTPETIMKESVKKGEKVVTVVSALQQWVKQARRDEVQDCDKSMLAALSKDAYEEAEAYLLEGIETQAKKSEERKSGEKVVTKKTIQKHFAEIEAIPAGVNLYSSITVREIDKVSMGLFLRTLEEFFKFPYLASASRGGYGKVAPRYDIKVGDEFIEDFITQDDFGDVVIDFDKYGQDCVDAFDAWAKNVTLETLKVR